jgi:hypothetical protein
VAPASRHSNEEAAMLALLAAAAVVATPDVPNIPPMPAEAMDVSRMPNLYAQPARCRDQPYHVVDRFGRPVTRKLGELPRGGAQLLVDRKVGGCRVVTLMYGSDAPAPDQPNPPPGKYRIEPLRPK